MPGGAPTSSIPAALRAAGDSDRSAPTARRAPTTIWSFRRRAVSSPPGRCALRSCATLAAHSPLLVVLGLMGATAATLAAQLPSQAGTEVETRVALRRTLEAIYGNGSGAGGFLGDVGRLPALEELVGRGDLPAAQRAQGIAAGWS